MCGRYGRDGFQENERAGSQCGEYSRRLSAEGVSALASNAALISAGFEIGGHLGRVLFGMGDEYEHYREMIIMDDIGTALAAAFPKYAAPAGDKHVVGDSRYDTTFRMVAAGEALCYVRLKGEYSILEYEKGKQGAPDDKELDRLYASAADRMNLCYMALASIFPERLPGYLSTLTLSGKRYRQETIRSAGILPFLWFTLKEMKRRLKRSMAATS